MSSSCLICGAGVVTLISCHVCDDPGVCILLKLANYSNVDTRRGCGSGEVSCSGSGLELQWPWVNKFVLCNQCKVELEEVECVLEQLEELHQNKATQFQKKISNRIQSAIKIQEEEDGDVQPKVLQCNDGDLIKARRWILSELDLELQSESQSPQPLNGQQQQHQPLGQRCPGPNPKWLHAAIRLHRIEEQFPSVFESTVTNINASIQQLPTSTTRTEEHVPDADYDDDFDPDLIKDEPHSTAELSEAEYTESSPEDSDRDESINRHSTRKKRRVRRTKIKFDPGRPSREGKVLCKYPKCDFRCMRLTQLEPHVQSIHFQDGVCGRCGVFFPNQAEKLAAHVQVHDDEEQARVKLRGLHRRQTMEPLAAKGKLKSPDEAYPDKCPYCEKLFPADARKDPAIITNHIATHTKPYKCGVEGCSASFACGKSLRAHCIKMHPEMKIPAFRCPYADTVSGCSFTSAYQAMVYRHVKTMHSQTSTDKSFEPDYSEKSPEITDKGDINQTKSQNRAAGVGYAPPGSDPSSRERRVCCKYPECDFRCMRSTQLESHVGMAHSERSVCSLCGAFFAGERAEAELAAHEQAHVDEIEARAKLKDLHRNQILEDVSIQNKATNIDHCPYCQKVFSAKAQKNPSIIINHIATHTKPYKCGVEGCSASFACGKPLRAHCIKIHPEMKIPAFRCPYADSGCSFTSGYSGSIRGHVRAKHALEERPTFPCTVAGCDFQAASTGSLKVHVNMVHERKKDCLCTECGYSSYTKTDLIKHMRRHTGEKPFTCTTCGRTFAGQSNLKSHEKIHGSDRRPDHVCDQCGKAYFGKNKLKKHIRMKHNQEEGT